MRASAKRRDRDDEGEVVWRKRVHAFEWLSLGELLREAMGGVEGAVGQHVWLHIAGWMTMRSAVAFGISCRFGFVMLRYCDDLNERRFAREKAGVSVLPASHWLWQSWYDAFRDARAVDNVGAGLAEAKELETMVLSPGEYVLEAEEGELVAATVREPINVRGCCFNVRYVVEHFMRHSQDVPVHPPPNVVGAVFVEWE